MEWATVALAALGSTIPILLALIAAARWTGRIEKSVEVMTNQAADTTRELSRLSAEIASTYDKVRDLEVNMRERLARAEQVINLTAEATRSPSIRIPETEERQSHRD